MSKRQNETPDYLLVHFSLGGVSSFGTIIPEVLVGRVYRLYHGSTMSKTCISNRNVGVSWEPCPPFSPECSPPRNFSQPGHLNWFLAQMSPLHPQLKPSLHPPYSLYPTSLIIFQPLSLSEITSFYSFISLPSVPQPIPHTRKKTVGCLSLLFPLPETIPST